ncbi:MAG TPA: cation diffusion facilitator family transporter [Acidimicrobiales bacterium]
MSTGGSTRAILAALFANLGIAIAKFIGFLFTSSSSMLAESVHSVADTGNQALLLLGGRRSRREATQQHPFGFGRERFFWAFVVSIVLFTLGSAFALYEGIEKLLHPHELESAEWAIGILLVAICLESWSFRTAVKEARPLKGNASWVRFIRRSKQPELPVVLLEDAGALIGLVLALAAVGMSIITGNAVWDGVGTTCIGVLLGAIAIVLAIEMKSLLIGEAASEADEAAITAAIVGADSVRQLIDLRTEHIGPETILVAAKVQFDDGLTMRELADVVDALEARVRGAVPAAARIFVEPDVVRPMTAAQVVPEEPGAGHDHH